MNRRGFLGALGAAIAGAVASQVLPDPEQLLWVPGAKAHILPPPQGWRRGDGSLFNPRENVAEQYRKGVFDRGDGFIDACGRMYVDTHQQQFDVFSREYLKPAVETWAAEAHEEGVRFTAEDLVQLSKAQLDPDVVRFYLGGLRGGKTTMMAELSQYQREYNAFRNRQDEQYLHQFNIFYGLDTLKPLEPSQLVVIKNVVA